jgi:hypothetical protein
MSRRHRATSHRDSRRIRRARGYPYKAPPSVSSARREKNDVHGPHSRPQPKHIVDPRQHDVRHNEPAGVAELVPAGHHAAHIRQVVVRARVVDLGEVDLECAVARRDRGGVVPLQIVCLPVVQVDRLPVWVLHNVGSVWAAAWGGRWAYVSRVEAATIHLELVAEDERHRLRRIVVTMDVINILDSFCERSRITSATTYLGRI